MLCSQPLASPCHGSWCEMNKMKLQKNKETRRGGSPLASWAIMCAANLVHCSRRAASARLSPPRAAEATYWPRAPPPDPSDTLVVCVRGALAPREPLREVRASQEIFASTHTHTAYRTSDNRPTRILKTGRQGCT